MLDFELAFFQTNAHHAAMDSVPKLTTDAAGNPKPRGRTRFQPGQSGNPKGKPRGANDAASNHPQGCLCAAPRAI
jgi:Family of unknown function (DUF5681)